jgi:IS30 family transposase
MEKSTSRITLSDRVVIEAGLYAHHPFNQIARAIRKHPASVSREIRGNRTAVGGERPFGKDCIYAAECKSKNVCGDAGCRRRCVGCHERDCREGCSRYDARPCPRLDKPPYVCNTCERRRKCRADRAYYSAVHADAAAGRRYSESHMGIRTRGGRLERLDGIVSPLVRKGQPLTHIHAEHGGELGVSQRTLYNYIGAGALSIGDIDLRRKVGYRPRRKKREQPEAFRSQDFRKGRGYDDFLGYIGKHPGTRVVEMDTVFGVRERGKRLLTMNFNKNNLLLLLLLRDGKAETVDEAFDFLTSLVGVEAFRRLFQAILTDNGGEFKHADELERAVDGRRRTRLFYCDPQASWQKPHVEKNHEYIRYVLPRGKSLSPYTQEDMTLLANHINSTRRAGLGNASPYELVDDKDTLALMRLLGLERIPPDEVFLKPALLHPRKT